MSSEHPPNFVRFAQAAKGHHPREVFRCLREELERLSPDDDSERASIEWRLYEAWARKAGICVDPPASGEATGGGHEHDVYFCPAEGYYIKCTKRNGAGLIYDPELQQLCPATVCEYLLRLVLQDLIFCSETEVLGIAVDGRDLSIVTRQQAMSGRLPTNEELAQWLAEWNVEQTGYVSGRPTYRLFGCIHIADLRADNCRMECDDEGNEQLTAFDLIISSADDPEELIRALDRQFEPLG